MGLAGACAATLRRLWHPLGRGLRCARFGAPADTLSRVAHGGVPSRARVRGAAFRALARGRGAPVRRATATRALGAAARSARFDDGRPRRRARRNAGEPYRHQPDGTRACAEWHLSVDALVGPEIPCLPAILISRKLVRGALVQRGAFACMGLLLHADFEPEFARWGIGTAIEERSA